MQNLPNLSGLTLRCFGVPLSRNWFNMVSVFHRRCCVSLKYLNRSLWCFPLFPELIATCGGWAQEPAVLCGGARPEGQKDLKYSPEIGLPSKSPYNCSKKRVTEFGSLCKSSKSRHGEQKCNYINPLRLLYLCSQLTCSINSYIKGID